MNCEECGGTGFVHQRDYVDRQRRTTHRNVGSVKRCSMFLGYFHSLDRIEDRVLTPSPGVCGAAIDHHEKVRDALRRKDKGKLQSQGSRGQF